MPSEVERASVLAEYPIDELRSERLDAIAGLAAQICETPIAAVSLVYDDRQVFVGRFGLETGQTPRSQSFCAHAMQGHNCMLVTNALEDARFSSNPLVLGAPSIRFYAGHPLISAEGVPLGAICVIDSKPRARFTPQQEQGLATLGGIVMALLESWRTEERNRRESSKLGVAVAELEQRFGLLADNMPQLVWMTQPDGNAIYFNNAWCDFTGNPAESSYGQNWLAFLHAEDAPVAAQAWDDAVNGRAPYNVRYRLRKHDGSYHWMIARGQPLRDGEGDIVRWVGTCTDINDEMQAADALEVLSHELDHRIKNTFAVISGLVGLSARDRPEAAAFAKDLSQRIMALSRAHGFALDKGQRSDAKHGMSLQGLIAELLAPYRNSDQALMTITGDDVSLTQRCTTPVALTIHELATNSAKYGAIGRPGGKLEVIVTDGDNVTIVWRETGLGKVDAPSRSGFGSRLLQMSIERQLGGRMESMWGGEGLQVTLSIPSANLKPHGAATGFSDDKG